MGFFLFLLVNAILFIRPTDFVPGLETVQVYVIAILACLATSATVIPGQLTSDSLKKRPITACVVAMLLTILLSSLVNLRIAAFFIDGIEFVKVLLFYLLLLGLVNTRERLRCYLLSVAGILTVPIGLALLQQYGYIYLTAFLSMGVDPDSGVRWVIEDGRLRGSGMFGDPNDVCLLINVGIMLSLYGVMSTRRALLKVLWVAPVALFGEALRQTGSRGGLLAFLASIAVLFVSRFGIRKGVLCAAVALPVTLTLFAGRQATFDVNSREDTASSAFSTGRRRWRCSRPRRFSASGPTSLKDLSTRLYTTHSSKLIRIWASSAAPSWWEHFTLPSADCSSSHCGLLVCPTNALDSMRPFIMGAMTGYVVTMMSTNHSYNVATYAILGMGAACIQLAADDQALPGKSPADRTMARVIVASIVYLVAMNIYIRLFCNF